MIPYSRQSISKEDIEAIASALNSPFLTQGPRVEEFETALCAYTGAKHALVMNSATSALYCAYAAVGICEGSEVITTPLSFVATANMLLALGATPVFCDVKSDGNIDERKIESLITKKTKAIVSVDFSGNPVEFATIATIAKAHNLAFISDSSHSIGAEIYEYIAQKEAQESARSSTHPFVSDRASQASGATSIQESARSKSLNAHTNCRAKKVGKQADATIFSFHAIKPITTGEGGALLTDSAEIYERAKRIRSHGVVKKALWNSDVNELGFNFRMSDFAAVLGSSQLKRLDSFIARRGEIVARYDEAFKDSHHFLTLRRNPNAHSSHHLYPIFLDRKLWCAKEDIFRAFHERGFGVQVHYKPIHTLSLYRGFSHGDLRNAEEFYLSELSLPCHQEMSDDDVSAVIRACDEIFDSFAGLNTSEICKNGIDS